MSPEASPTPVEPIPDDIPEMIQKAQAAFRRDLPELLKDRRLRGKWVAYHGEKQLAIGKSKTLLCQQCLQGGAPDMELYIRSIRPQLADEEEAELLTPEV